MRRSLRACALLLAGLLLAGCDDLAFVDDNIGCDRVRSISLGSGSSGSLDPGDCRLNDGSAADFYRFRVNSSRDVYVSMNSNSVTPYVAILDEYGSVVAEEDFGDIGYSELSVYLPYGTYYIVASSYNPGDYGSYFIETDYN